MKLRKKGQKSFRFRLCEAQQCPFESPVPKQQTPVILRLFKRTGDREPVLPEALPKASSGGRRWCQKAAGIVLFATWLTIPVTPSLCPARLCWSFPLALVRTGWNPAFVWCVNVLTVSKNFVTPLPIVQLMMYGMITVSEEDRRPQEFLSVSVALLLKTELSVALTVQLHYNNSRFSRELNFGLSLNHRTSAGLSDWTENIFPLTGWLLFFKCHIICCLLFSVKNWKQVPGLGPSFR